MMAIFHVDLVSQFGSAGVRKFSTMCAVNRKQNQFEEKRFQKKSHLVEMVVNLKNFSTNFR